MRACLAVLTLFLAASGCSDDDFGTGDTGSVVDQAVPEDLAATDEAVPADLVASPDLAIPADLAVMDALPVDGLGDLRDMGGG